MLGQSVIWKSRSECFCLLQGKPENHGIGQAFINWFLRVLFFIESSIYCYIDSSQCLAQLIPARIGIARSVHVQLGTSTHVIRWDIVSLSPQSHTSTTFGGLFNGAIKMSYLSFWRISQKRVHVQQIHQLDRPMSLLQQASLNIATKYIVWLLFGLLDWKAVTVVAVLVYPTIS